jgi:hypothetical protein
MVEMAEMAVVEWMLWMMNRRSLECRCDDMGWAWLAPPCQGLAASSSIKRWGPFPRLRGTSAQPRCFALPWAMPGLPATESLGLGLRRVISLDPATAEREPSLLLGSPGACQQRHAGRQLDPTCMRRLHLFQFRVAHFRRQAADNQFIFVHYLAISVLDEPFDLFVAFQSEALTKCFIPSH